MFSIKMSLQCQHFWQLGIKLRQQTNYYQQHYEDMDWLKETQRLLKIWSLNRKNQSKIHDEKQQRKISDCCHRYELFSKVCESDRTARGQGDQSEVQRIRMLTSGTEVVDRTWDSISQCNPSHSEVQGWKAETSEIQVLIDLDFTTAISHMCSDTQLLEEPVLKIFNFISNNSANMFVGICRMRKDWSSTINNKIIAEDQTFLTFPIIE